MKKTIALLLCVVTMLSFLCSVSSFAEENDEYYVLTVGNLEVQVLKGNLTDEECRRIAEALLDVTPMEGDEPQFNLICQIFGHNWEESTAYLYQHNYYQTEPHCMRVTYRVKTCKRCGEVERDATAIDRVNCH